MRYSLILLSSALMLTACAVKPRQAPVCSGNTLRGCKPVVYFASGSSALNDEAKENLDWAYAKMKRFPKEEVVVTGYTDSVGDAERNFTLAKQRAQAVKSYLVKKGIESDRVTVAFQGEFDPVCTKAECQHLNRRAELKLSKPNGGFEPIDVDKISENVSNIKCLLCEEE